jgi:hypothetical protein
LTAYRDRLRAGHYQAKPKRTPRKQAAPDTPKDEPRTQAKTTTETKKTETNPTD